MPSVLAAAHALAVPVHPEVLADLGGVTIEAVEAHVESGALIRDGERLRHNPLFGVPAEDPPTRAELRSALAAGPVVADDTRLALAQLALHDDDAEGATDALVALCRGAALAGTQAEVAASMRDSGSVPRFLALAREPVLLTLIEGGLLDLVRPLLTDDDTLAHVAAALVEGRPNDALETLPARSDRLASLLRARLLVELGRPAEVEAALGDWTDDVEALRIRVSALASLGEHGPAEALRESIASRTTEPRLMLWVHRERAGAALGRGDMKGANDALQALSAVVARVPAKRWVDDLEYMDAFTAFYRGHVERLELLIRQRGGTGPRWERARAMLELSMSRYAVARGRLEVLLDANDFGVCTMLAHLELVRGRADEAERWLEMGKARTAVIAEEESLFRRRIARMRGAPDPGMAETHHLWIRCAQILMSGAFALDAGDVEAATAHAREAAELLEAHELGLMRPELLLLEADILAHTGDRDGALARVERAEAVIGHPEAPLVRMVEAARHALQGTVAPDATLQAWAALEDVAPLAIVSRGRAVPDVVSAVLAPVPAPGLAILQAAFPSEQGAWLVTEDGGRFRPPGADWVDLRRRHALRNILRALTDTRFGAAPLTLEALRDAGWPDERMVEAAAKNRVHVALSTLRKLGLAGLVVKAGDGWRLDPEVPLRRVPTEA